MTFTSTMNSCRPLRARPLRAYAATSRGAHVITRARKDLQTGRAWQLEAYDVDEVIGKAFRFFEANESGTLSSSNRSKWRGDSFLRDGGKVDLVGGWFDAGGALCSHRSSRCLLQLQLTQFNGQARVARLPFFRCSPIGAVTCTGFL